MFRNCLLYFTIVSFPYLYNFVSSYKIDVTRSRWCNCLVRLQQWPCYLSARTWVRVPPTTSGFFSPVTRFLRSTIEPQREHLCHVPQLTSSMLSGVHVKQASNKKNTILHMILKQSIIIHRSHSILGRVSIHVALT